MTNEERFEKFLVKSGEHILFTGSLDRDGYGQFWLGGRVIHAEVAAWRLAGNYVCSAFEDMHQRADCPKNCVNIAHLTKVLRRNHPDVRSSIERSMTHCERGHPFDKENTYQWKNKRICRA